MTTKEILATIKNEINPIEFERYFKQLSYKKNLSNDSLAVFEIPNKFLANWIRTKYSKQITDALKKISNSDLKIQIISSGETKKSIENSIQKEEIKNLIESTILNPSYTFESFVVGSSNQMAYNASLAVAKNPGIQFNPLFIYGGTGLGKTHLLQAIGNLAIEQNKTVIYVTIEQFMNDFTFSLKNKNMEHFREKYRRCDILLIDDVQFLSNKEQTQEEFFHTFNELHNAKKQIIS